MFSPFISIANLPDAVEAGNRVIGVIVDFSSVTVEGSWARANRGSAASASPMAEEIIMVDGTADELWGRTTMNVQVCELETMVWTVGSELGRPNGPRGFISLMWWI